MSQARPERGILRKAQKEGRRKKISCYHGVALATTRSTSAAKPLLACVDLDLLPAQCRHLIIQRYLSQDPVCMDAQTSQTACSLPAQSLDNGKHDQYILDVGDAEDSHLMDRLGWVAMHLMYLLNLSCFPYMNYLFIIFSF